MTLPVTVLTGFLGAGKTTLLEHALRGPRLARALVVVNELGALPLDHLLVQEVREEVLLLESGCVCCAVREDLVQTLLAAYGQRPTRDFDRVVLETTGLADATPIVATLARQHALTRRFHLDALITAVDLEHAAVTLERHDEAEKQVLLADDVVFTKRDRVDDAKLDAVQQLVHARNPLARTFVSARGELDWGPLLERPLTSAAARLDLVPQRSQASQTVWSFSVRAEQPVDFRSFALWLSMVTQFHGETLLRVKGLLHVIGEHEPVVVQAVQHAVSPPYSLSGWPSSDRSSRVVAITRGMQLPLFEELRASLEQVLCAGGSCVRAAHSG